MFSREDCIPYLGHIMNENGREKQIYWCYSKHTLTIKMSNEFFYLEVCSRLHLPTYQTNPFKENYLKRKLLQIMVKWIWGDLEQD